MIKKNIILKFLLITFTFTFLVNTLSGCSNTKKESTTRTITDMAGREVTVKSKIDKVYSALPIGTVLIYTINPDKLVGKNFDLSDEEKKYTVEKYQELPVLGNYIVGNTANVEELLSINPDIILYMGTIDETWIAAVKKAQEKINIPIVMVDASLEKLPEVYEFVGDLLGEKERTKVLSNYCTSVINQAKEISDKISEDKKIGVYYAAGSALTTYPNGTIHSELINLVGGLDVVNVGFKNGYARAQVSPEDLLKWDPDVIIVNKANARIGEGDDLRSIFLSDSRFGDLKAVKDKTIYEIPYLPFSWFGEPPSVNRILGIKWLGNLLYPNEYNFDIKKEAKDFYKTFYYLDITDEELEDIMSNTI